MGTRRFGLRYLLPATALAGCGLNLVGSLGGDDAGDASTLGTIDSAIGKPDVDTPEIIVVPLEDASALDVTPKKDVVTIDAPPPVDATTTEGGCPTGRYFCPTSATCTTTCTSCKKAELGCPTTMTCTEGCTTCPGNAFECWACAADTTTLVFAGCTPTTNPTGGCYVNGRTHCTNCESAGCFGDHQVCLGLKGSKSECRGCGEQDTNNAPCAGKGSCEASKLLCK